MHRTYYHFTGQHKGYMTDQDYFDLPDVSNSDLTYLQYELSGRELPDLTDAFELGTLVDAMITEPERVSHIRQTLDGNSQRFFKKALAMTKAFRNDALANTLIKGCEFQKVSRKQRLFTWNDVEFWLPCRCKWDFFGHVSGDIKTTAATTQKQFVAACEYFGYFRSRAWYMDIEETERDVLIGISKVNHKVFYVKINRGDERHTQGVREYTDLALKYWALKMKE